ncbi:histone RNA hairpin-binding protein [Drosophila hydei]|uniref:Histone RNA hairpin-binding protein n=1 Tax=Drosophila hydei TaxID=7224 RepID=A0A6J1LG80_DROHY|nr:histone RNA hairpin-binding protein [Drosophila hydei]
MMFEDQRMSVDAATPLKRAGSLNSSGSSISMDAKPLNSWAQEVRAELGHSDEASSSFNSSAGSTAAQQKREMTLEFLDGSNEEKFERLVKEEKLKTPFKRRHSVTPPTLSTENSRSNSPNSSASSTTNEGNPCTKAHHFKGHKEEKRVRHNSYTSSTSSSSSYTEADPAILSRRQKQIDYGKNTAAYERYTETVPKSDRTREHPRTPNKFGKYSRRAFDGLVKIWRKQLHFYDPPTAKNSNTCEVDSDSDSD